MTAIGKLRLSYLGLLRLLPNRFNGPVLAGNGVLGNLLDPGSLDGQVTDKTFGRHASGSADHGIA